MTTRPERSPAGGARGIARQRRLARILDAATELFADRGFARTSVDEIASQARVSKGLVYDHYPSKEALLTAVWERQVEAWMEATTLEVKVAAGSLAEAIGDVLSVSVRHARDNPLLRRILVQDPGSLAGADATDVAAFARFYRERLEPVLAHGVRNGELRADLDVPYTAELVWLLHFTLIREIFLGAGPGLRGDADDLLRAAVALVVSGLRAP
jgi:AcrR family transcriptional regulator